MIFDFVFFGSILVIALVGIWVVGTDGQDMVVEARARREREDK